MSIGPDAAVKDTQVDQQMSALSCTIDDLQSIVTKLEGGLCRAVRAPSPSVASADDNGGREELVPIAECVHNCVNRVRTQRMLLENLYERLEI